MSPHLSPHLLALGFTLLHFCWQAALIACLYKTAETLLPGLKPSRRYEMALAALLAMLIAAVVTFVLEEIRLGQEIVIAVDAVPETAFSVTPLKAPLKGDDISLHALLPWLDMVWLFGVLGLTLRMTGGLWQIHSLSRTAVEVPDALLHRFKDALQRTGLSKRVQVRLHPVITGPFVVGVMRAVVYLPFSAVTHLSPSQLDAILAHELEHIRRFDYLWNLIQTLVETLFFYHPAVWWLGRTLREQRELCCDDAALDACNDPLTYATALLRLEEQRPRPMAINGLVMALNGQGEGSGLLSRISRMLGEGPARTPAGRYNPLVAVPLILLSLSGFVAPAAQVAASTPAVAAIPKFVASVMPVAAPAPVASVVAAKPKAEKADVKAAVAAGKEAAKWNGSWDQEAYQTAYQEAMSEAAQTRLEAQLEANAEALRAQQEAQREALDAQREAQREALQEAEDARREAQDVQREAARERRNAEREMQREAEARAREQANNARQRADSLRINAQTQRLRAEAMLKAADRMALSAKEMALKAEALRVEAERLSNVTSSVPPAPPAATVPPAPATPWTSMKAPLAPVPPAPPKPLSGNLKSGTVKMVGAVRQVNVSPNPQPNPQPDPHPDPQPNPKPVVNFKVSTEVRMTEPVN